MLWREGITNTGQNGSVYKGKENKFNIFTNAKNNKDNEPNDSNLNFSMSMTF